VKKKQDKQRKRPEPIDENRDYPFAPECDQSLDLLCYAEALDKKHKDPNYDMMNDTRLVKAMSES